jgi:hypothetical protein
MVTSAIASSHFYYIALITSEQIKTAKDLIGYFPDKTDYEKLPTADKDVNFFHVQSEILKTFGSENLLLVNRSEKTANRPFYYWYDF